MAEEKISTTKGALIALGFLGAMVVLILCVCEILPNWIFRVVYLFVMGGLWFSVISKLWPKMTARQKGWFSFWEYGGLIAAIGAGAMMDKETGFLQRLNFMLTASIFIGLFIALIYNLIFKTKGK